MKQIFYSLFLVFTVSALATAQISEDFEAGFPADWSKEDAWQHGTGPGLSSTYFNIPDRTMIMAVNDDAAGPNGATNGRMVTPAVDLTGVDYPFLFFDYYFLDGDYDADEQANLLVSVDTGATWTQLRSLQSSNWGVGVMDLKDYVGQTVWLAFEYLDGGGWNYGLAVDNVELVDYRVFSDVSFFEVSADCSHAIEGAEFGFRIAVQNIANQALNSMRVSVQGPDGQTESMVADMDIAPFERTYVGVPLSYEMAQEDQMYSITIDQLSTGEDEEMSDNTLDFMVEYINPQPKSAVVVEEATGTWCTWCPRGAVYMDRATQCFGDHFVGIAVHNEDPMVNSEYDDGITSFPGFSGFPSVIVDRTNIIDPADIFQPIADKIVNQAAVEIDIDARVDNKTRELTVNAFGMFNQDIPAGYRWNAVLVEDGLTGTSSTWRQINAYSGGNFGLMGGYENLPSPVPAQQMVYDHVGRELLAGFDGAAGSIPDLGAGDTTSYAFDAFSIPLTYEIENLKVAVWVHDNTGKIVAAGETDVEMTTDVFYVDNKEVNWTVAPNPIQDHATATITLPESGDIQLTMIDMLGRVVSQQRYNQPQGTMTYAIERNGLPSGMYSVILTYGGQSDVIKVVMN